MRTFAFLAAAFLTAACAAGLLAAPASAFPVASPDAPGLAAPARPVAYNGDPYSNPRHGGGGRRKARKDKTPDTPADTSKGETPDQHKAYLKNYGFGGQ